MRKLVSCVSLLLALGAVGISANDTPVVGHAAEALETTLKEEVVYEASFDSYNVGDNGATVAADNLFWFPGNDNMAIVERNGSNALQYTPYANNPFAVMGTNAIGNLSRLIDGQKYTISMDIYFDAPTAGGFLQVEYTVPNWTGARLDNTADGITYQTLGIAQNVTFNNNRLTYSFIAGRYHADTSKYAYFAFNIYDWPSDGKIIFDNISITRPEPTKAYEYNLTFEEYEVGTESVAKTESAISKIYNGGGMNSITVQSENNNKYLHVSHPTTTEVWTNFYVNQLWDLVDQNQYRVTMDILEHNFAEIYFCYTDPGDPCVTYGPTSYLYKDNSENLIGGSFDGTHLTFDFKVNTTFNANFPRQFNIVVKHSTDLVLKIDNIKIAKLDTIVKSFDLNTINAKLEYGIGESLDLSGVNGTLTKADGYVRTIKNNEIVFDTTNVNMSVAGTYAVKAHVVDAFGVKLEKELTITVTDNLANAKALIADVTAIDTCTEYEQYDALKARYDALSEEEKAYFDAAVLDAKTGMLVKDKLAYMGTLCETKAKEANTSSNLLSSLNSYSGTNMILLVGILGLALIAVYYAYNRKRLAK